MEISYDSKYVTKYPVLYLPMSIVQKQPKITIGQSSNNFSSLFMYDPDAVGNIFVHWVVLNIPKNSDISKGETVVPYYPPSPPKGSGKHNYIIKLFLHDNKKTIDKNSLKDYTIVSGNLSNDSTLYETLMFVSENKENEEVTKNIAGGVTKKKFKKGRKYQKGKGKPKSRGRKTAKKYISYHKNMKRKSSIKKTRK